MTDSITGTTRGCPRSEVDPYSDEFLADPFQYLAELRDAGPVVYLSHEGDEDLHGRRLGLDFAEFMTRWSNLGCPGPEMWALEPFYDRRERRLRDAGPAVDRWKEWVGGNGRKAKKPRRT